MKKRILSMLIAIVMLVGILPANIIPVFADVPTSGVSGDCEWTYDKSSGALTIYGDGAMEDYSEYESPWFGYDGYFDVVIEHGVTHIGDYAFSRLPIYNVTIPSTVESIGTCAFAWDEYLSSIKYYGDTLPDIGDNAFAEISTNSIYVSSKFDPGVEKFSDHIDNIYRSLTPYEVPEKPLSNDDFAGEHGLFFSCFDDDSHFYKAVFDEDFASCGEVYAKQGEYYVDVTWNTLEAFNYLMYTNYEPHEADGEFPEYSSITAKWNAESEKWELDSSNIISIVCASAPEEGEGEGEGEGDGEDNEDDEDGDVLTADFIINASDESVSRVVFNTLYRNSVYQYPIYAEDIAMIEGCEISAFTFYYINEDSTTIIPQDIEIYVEELEIGEDFSSIYMFDSVENATLVYDETFNYGETSDTTVYEFEVPFIEPFAYNGGDLLVTVIKNAVSYSGHMYFVATAGAGRFVQSDSETYSAETLDSVYVSNTSSHVPQTKISFIPDDDPVSIIVNDTENGTVSAPAGHFPGFDVSFTVTPDEGYAIDSVSVVSGDEIIDYSLDNGKYVFTMPEAEVEIFATFKALAYNTVSIDESYLESATAKLSIDDSTERSFYEGEEVKFCFSPKTGYKITEIIVSTEDGPLSFENVSSGVYKFTMPTKPVTINANIVPLYYGKVTAHEDLVNGTLVINNENWYENSYVYFEIVSHEGYFLDEVYATCGEDEVDVNEGFGGFSFTMPGGDVVINASFIQLEKKPIVKGNTPENGSFSISADEAYSGSTITITATPDEMYNIDTITVTDANGNAVPLSGLGLVRTFIMPESEVTVSMTFIYDPTIIIGADEKLFDNVPFTAYYKNSASQQLIKEEDLEDAEFMLLNKFTYFYVNEGAYPYNQNVKVYLSSPEGVDDLSASEFVDISDATLVFDGVITYEADELNVTKELEIEFDDPYYYSGGNLLVTVIKTSDNFANGLKFKGISAALENATLCHRTDELGVDCSNITSVTPTRTTYAPLIKISYGFFGELLDINISESENGTISAPAESYPFMPVTIKTTPDSFYVTDKVTVMCGEEEIEVTKVGINEYTFIMPEAEVTVSATFKFAEFSYIILPDKIKYGTINSAYNGLTVAEGTWVAIEAVPAGGYVVKSLSLMCGDEEIEFIKNDNYYEFVMPAGDVYVNVEFTPISEVTLYDGTEYDSGFVIEPYYRNSISQQILDANDLEYIVGAKLKSFTYYTKTNASDEQRQNVKIYLKEVEETNAVYSTNDKQYVDTTGSVLVFDGAVTYEYGVQGEICFEFNKDPFIYTGGNLLVTIVKQATNYSGGSVNFYGVRTSGPISVYDKSDSIVFTLESRPYWATYSSSILPKTKIGVEFPERYEITLEETENGTVSVPKLSFSGKAVTVSVTPDEGYCLNTLTVMYGEEEIAITNVGDNEYTFEMPEGDVILSADFVEITSCNITVSEDIQNATVTVASSAYMGEIVNISVSPAEGYVVDNVTVKHGEQNIYVTKNGSEYSFRMPAGDVEIYVTTVETETLKFVMTDSFGDGWTGNKISVYYLDGEKEVFIQDVTLENGKEGEAYIDIRADQTIVFKMTTGNYSNECEVRIYRNGFLVYNGGIVTDSAITSKPIVSHNITVSDTIENATVEVKSKGAVGENITVTICPETTYIIEKISIIKGDEIDEASIPVGTTAYTFEMPDCDVFIDVSIIPAPTRNISIAPGIDVDINDLQMPCEAYAGSYVTVKSVNPAVCLEWILYENSAGNQVHLTRVSDFEYEFMMPNEDVALHIGTVDREYDIYVGTERVTSSNLVIEGDEGTATFNPITSTLTLDNFKKSVTSDEVFESNFTYVIRVSRLKNIKLVLIGDNYLEANGHKNVLALAVDGNLEISGSGSLTTVGENYMMDKNIQCEVSGIYAVNLVVKSGDISSIVKTNIYNTSGYYIAQKLTVDGGIVRGYAESFDEIKNIAFFVAKEIEVNGGSLIASVNGEEKEIYSSINPTALHFGNTFTIGENVQMVIPTSIFADNRRICTADGKVATYVEIGTPHEVIISDETENGTLTTKYDAHVEGAEVYVSALTELGIGIDEVSVMCGETELEVEMIDSLNFSFIMPDGDVTVSATFKEYPVHSITVSGKTDIAEVASEAIEGALVNISVSLPASTNVEVSASFGEEKIEVKRISVGKYSFIMPAGDVDVNIDLEYIYDIGIGETNFTSKNLTIYGNSGTATYDPETSTITLNNFKYDGNGTTKELEFIDHAIITKIAFFNSTSSPLTIVTEGTNEIFFRGYGSYVMCSNASLTFKGDGDLIVYSDISQVIGIYVHGGDLTIQSGRVESTAYGQSVEVDGDMYISGGDVMLYSERAECIYLQGGLYISGGDITCQSMKRAIFVSDGIEISGGEITVAGTNIEATVVTNGDFKITGGDIEITSYFQTEYRSEGSAICARTLEMLGGTLVAKSYETSDAIVFYHQNDIDEYFILGDNMEIITPENSTFGVSDYTETWGVVYAIIGADGGIANEVKIAPKAPPAIEFVGAQIRTSGEQGLRFVFSMSKEYYDTLTQPESYTDVEEGFGTVILPADLLGDETLSKDTESAAVVPAVVLYDVTDTNVLYTVCLTNISDYTREYVVVPYATDADGNTTYGEIADGISVYEIAELCYNDPNVSASLKDYLLSNVLSMVDPEKYPVTQ